MLRKVIGIGALGCLVALLAVSVAVAQPGGGAAGGGQRGQRGQGMRGNFDPEQMRQMMAERMQEDLEVSAEEWKIVGPRVEKVQQLSRDANAGGMFGGRMRGGMMGNRGNRRGGMMGAEEGEQTDVQKKTEALQTLLEGSPSNDSIKTALTALRQAKEKARQELATAQAQLREVLSLRQEARAVLRGLLD